MLWLIEASNVIHRMYWGLPPMARPGDDHPVNVAHGCATAFWRLIKQHPSHVAIVLDGKNSRQARQALDPDYKANRKPTPDALKVQMPFARQAAEAFGFKVVEMEGQEADDVIATYTRIARQAGMEVCILSTDKDFYQLIADDVFCFDPLKNRPIMAADVVAKYGVPPEMMIDFQAMTGDPADNIKGIPKIGDKTAAKLLRKFGTLDGVIELAHLIEGDSVRERITSYGERALADRELVRLNQHVPVEYGIEDFAYGEFDVRAVLDFLDELKLVTLRNEIATGMMVPA